MLTERRDPSLGIIKGGVIIHIVAVGEEIADIGELEIPSLQLIPQIERSLIEGNNSGQITGIATLD